MNESDLKQIDELLQKRLKGFATKDDLKGFATKDDLKRFATKDDLKELKKDLLEKMNDMEMSILGRVEEFKADKETVHALDTRLKKVEQQTNYND